MRIKKGDTLQNIYEDRNGKLTQRFVPVLATTVDLLIAFCCYRRAPRSFAWQKTLSIQVERDIPRESTLIMTTRQTGGLHKGYKPKLPASV